MNTTTNSNTPKHTINQATSIIRLYPERASQFLTHPDKKVVARARFSLEKRFGKEYTGGIPAPAPKAVEVLTRIETPMESPPPNQELLTDAAEFQAVADKYEVSVAEVTKLVEEKGSLDKAKRSLAAKKGAAAKAAAKKAAN